jgi:hypothetical protein
MNCPGSTSRPFLVDQTQQHFVAAHLFGLLERRDRLAEDLEVALSRARRAAGR